MYQALFFSLSSQRSKEAKKQKKKEKKITPDLRLHILSPEKLHGWRKGGGGVGEARGGAIYGLSYIGMC